MEFYNTIIPVLNNNIALSGLVNSNLHCLDYLYKNVNIIDYGGTQFLRYLASESNRHSYSFKKGKIPDPLNWNYINKNGKLSLESSLGTVCSLDNKNHFEIGADYSLLNCEFPHKATIKYNSVYFKTDNLGRIIEINFPAKKQKFKDTLKLQLKVNDILLAKNQKGLNQFCLIPKDMGGGNFWINVIGISKDKDNKKATKVLNKTLKEFSKLNDRNINVKLSYDSGDINPYKITYMSGGEEICTFYNN